MPIESILLLSSKSNLDTNDVEYALNAACEAIPCDVCGGSKQVEQDCGDCDGRGTNHCEECGGDGRVPCSYCDEGNVECRECEGSGEVECSLCKGDCKVLDGTDPDGVECPDCEGHGAVRCEDCGGDGQVECDNCDGEGRAECPECGGGGEVDCETCNGDGKEWVPCEECDEHGRRWIRPYRDATRGSYGGEIVMLFDGIGVSKALDEFKAVVYIMEDTGEWGVARGDEMSSVLVPNVGKWMYAYFGVARRSA